jgi:phage protein D
VAIDDIKVTGLWTEVFLDGAEVSANVSPYLTRLEYKDGLEEGKPCSIAVTLADPLGKFQSDYYPKRGASLRFAFGYDNNGQSMSFKSGAGFVIDMVEITGAPDTVKWTATGQMPGSKFHRNTSKRWENKTLEDIASEIAKKHGATLYYKVAEPIELPCECQVGESDYQFIRMLAERYSLIMSLTGGKDRLTLVISDVGSFMEGEPVYEITRQHTINFSFSEELVRGAGGAVTRYFDSDDKKLVRNEVTTAHPTEHEINTVGVMAAPKAHVKGLANNLSNQGAEGKLTLPGNPRLLAGVKVNLSGWHRNDGEWLVEKTMHSLVVGANEANGYLTTLTIKRK